jgi:SAM-dependent methyltransferase
MQPDNQIEMILQREGAQIKTLINHPADWDVDNQRIVNFYSGLVRRYEGDPRALDWGSRDSQALRFSILAQVARVEGASVLDVGCGVGDLLEYLRLKEVSVDYTGYDLTPEMIQSARRRFPEHRFETRDLLMEQEPTELFDYVLASGIFYLRQYEPMRYLESMARRMFAACRKGVAFNTLSIMASQRAPGEFYADPADVLKMCLEITPSVAVRHDYLPHDFTVYLYKARR